MNPTKTAAVPAAPPLRSMDKRNLAVRVASAAVFIVLFLTLLHFGEQLVSKLIFLGLLCGAAFVGVREMCLIGRKSGSQPSILAGTVVAWALILHFFLNGDMFKASDVLPLWSVFVIGFFVIHFGMLLFYEDPISQALPSQAITWMGALMLGLGLGFQMKLFMFNETTVSNTGARLILALYMVVWLGDTLAYFAGSFLGKHRLAPKVSPKKTWEGAVGNLLGNVGGAYLAKTLVCREWSPVDVVAIGVCIGIAGILGDLVESTWKRGAGVKDSAMGIEIPGHGGILDRMDSLLFAAPALYAYVHFVHGLN
jgi:phosphatidate cytidylyltransferase